MAWSRTGNPLDLLIWLLLSLGWWAGGWLICTHVFRLRSRERLMAGLGCGLLLFIVLSNLLGQILPFPIALWFASLLILVLGLFSAWRSPVRPWLILEDWKAWPQLLAFAGMLTLFSVINRGLAIFDEYHNLPLLSRIAAGDLPPHFYLNPDQPLVYHYGLHIFAASLVRIGGIFPWGAFDLARALSLALTLNLGWLWFTRIVHKGYVVFFGCLLLLFGGGARWLLLFLPADSMGQISAGLHFLGSAAVTGPDLYTVLTSAWKIEGGGLFPFPFALTNGLFTPLTFALGGSGAVPQLTILLLMLVARRHWRPLAGLVFGLILASLALTAEHLYVMLWIGFLLAAILTGWMLHSRRQALEWGWSLGISALIALFGGGVITGIIRGWQGAQAFSYPEQTIGIAGFALRWPPALVSAHLGAMSLVDPGQLLVALAELGPILLIAPWVSWWCWKRMRRGQVLLGGLGLAAVIGFLVPIFIRYGVERDISRLTDSALFIWMLLGFVIVWFAVRKAKPGFQALAGTGYSIAVLAGIGLFMIELIAVPHPQATYFVQEPDVVLSQKYWNKLDIGAQIFDPVQFRAVTLFGRAEGKAFQDIYTPLKAWEGLVANPDPYQLNRAGYSYLYVDKTYWQNTTPQQKQALQQACIQRVAAQTGDDRDFRWLLDVRSCK